MEKSRSPYEASSSEEKSGAPAVGKHLTAMQKTFIKSSINMRKQSKMQASEMAPNDTLVGQSMESEVMVLAEDEYEEMLQDIEHPATYVSDN